MPEVTVEVGGRSYRVGCGEGEEDHLIKLASYVDREASKLTKQLGQMSEGRLMLMTALVMADLLSDMRTGIADAEARASDAEARADQAASATATHPEVSDSLSSDREQQIAASLDQLSTRIESLVGRIEGRG
ncbi:MAG: cell division protein ZapA [Pseudomonadota bacterium]